MAYTVPNVFAGETGNQSAAQLDVDFTACLLGINNAFLVGLLSARPAADGIGNGRYYFATDDNGGTLYRDNGTAWVKVASSVAVQASAADQLSGCGLTRTSGTAITVAAGVAASDDAVYANRLLMSLVAATQGNTAGTWVVGTNQNKLDTGAIGATQTWHVYVIERPDTGVVDIAFSQSATTVTVGAAIPSAYTKQRRIGSFTTDGANAIVEFSQDGDDFVLSGATLPALYSQGTPGVAAVLATLPGIPTGLKVGVRCNFQMSTDINTNYVYFSSPDQADIAPAATTSPLHQFNNLTAATVVGQLTGLRTNTSAQIRYRLTGSDAGVTVRIQALGWIDRRGKG